MRTAIIGLGNIGSRLAKNLTHGGVEIIVADRTFAKAQELSNQLGSNASALPINDAMESADVIILAVYLDAMKELISRYRSLFVGKIVVDPSNPIGPDGKGGLQKIIPPEQSSGQLIAALLPEGTESVKAFGSLGAASLELGANRSPERAVLFYATDFPEASRVISKLITASGFSPVAIGAIDQSIRMEVGGDLHEFGELGRLVSVDEAKTILLRKAQ